MSENAVYRIFVHSILTASLLLERTLSNIHSTFQTSINSINLDGSSSSSMENIQQKRKRAFWDPKKGSAIVIWCSGDQSELTQQLSLALASIGKTKNRSGYPPYTVIVLISENSDQLPSLISGWAKRKAEMNLSMNSKEKKEEDQSKEVQAQQQEVIEDDSVDTDDYSSSLNLSKALELVGLGSVSSALGLTDDTPYHSQDSSLQKMKKDSSSERNISPNKNQKRRLSLGGWTAQDVVGYGRDMLKGLRIGEMEQSGIGAVIPVVVDITNPSGLQHAQSTIQAYCMSHDLLLRALILIPSIMQNQLQSQNVSIPSKRPRAASSQNNSNDNHEKLSILAKQTSTTLSSDVGESLNLLATLLPLIKHDGGRIIGLLPSEIRLSSSDICSDQIQFNITRKALMTMWTDVRKLLQSEGIMVSLIHMIAWPSFSQSHDLSGKIQRKDKLNDGKHFDSILTSILISIIANLTEEFQRLTSATILTLLEILYGVPSFQMKQKSSFQSNDDLNANQLHQVRQSWQATNLEELHDGIEQESGGSSTISSSIEMNCPSLLLDSVRSALIRTWPRQNYSVGLGPHLESVWNYVPGHSIMNKWVKDLLLLPTA